MATPVAMLNVLLTANTTQATSALTKFDRQMNASAANAAKRSASTSKVIAAGFTRAAGVTAAAATGAVVAAAKYEDAFADVRKTVDATDSQFKRLETGILNMSKRVPIAATELAHLAGEAGALGIPAKNLLRFTKVAAQLGTATDMSASDAANALARLGNILEQKTVKDFEKMGATLVDLGNKGASTEGEISSMALRIAGAGKTVGLTAKQVLGLAASMANVGIRAEMGGSAISRVLLQMQDAVARNSEELTNFARISGMTIPQFKRQFARDAPGAVAIFTAGLDRMNQGGKSVVQTLEGVNLSELRVRDTLLRLGGASGEVAKGQQIANAAWAKGTALNIEAAKKYKTTASQFELLKNRAFALGVTLGHDLLPQVNKVMKMLGEGDFGGAIKAFARLGVEAAKTLGKALLNAFVRSDWLGRIFIGASVIRLVGGKGALLRSGVMIGRFLGIGVATGMAESAAGGAAAGGAAGAAGAGGGIMGALRNVKWARVGAIGVGIMLADSIMQGVQLNMAKQSGDLLDSLEAQTKASIAGISLPLSVHEGALQKLTGLDLFGSGAAQKAKDLKAEIERISQLSGGITRQERLRVKAMAEQVDLSDEQQLQLKQLLDTAERQALKFKGLDLTSDIRLNWDKGLRNMVGLTDKRLDAIRNLFRTKPEAARKALAAAFDKGVKNVKRAMDQNEISTRNGLAIIESLVRKKLALFGVTGSAADRALHISQGGDTSHQGLQRGGLMMVPGTGSGDKVPLSAMVEPGEGVAVVNRNAAKALMAWNDEFPRWQKGGTSFTGAGRRRKGRTDDFALPRWTNDTAVGATGAAALNRTAAVAEKALKAAMAAGGVAGSWRSVDALARRMGLSVSSAYRPGDDGFHGSRQAKDYSDGYATPAEFRFGSTLARTIPSKLLELIHTPLGYSFDNFHRTAPFAQADHYDHVHVALSQHYQKGGMIRPVHGRGARFVHGGNQYNADEAATLMYQVGARVSEARRLSQKVWKESAGIPNRVGTDPGGTQGLGLWMITTGYNDALIKRLGGRQAMFDPVINAIAALQIYRQSGIGAWYAPDSPAGDIIGKWLMNTEELLKQHKEPFKTGRDAVNYLMNRGVDKALAQRAGHHYYRSQPKPGGAKGQGGGGGGGGGGATGGATATAGGKSIADLLALADTFADYADTAESLTVGSTKGTIFGGDQAYWLNQELQTLFTLRNRLVEKRLSLMQTIASQTAKLEKAQAEVDKARKALKNAESAKAKKAAQAGLDTAIKKRDRIKGNLDKSQTNLSDTMDSLTEIQGLGRSMEFMAMLPADGVLGGRIFDVTMALRELGASPNASDRKGLTADQLREIGYLRDLGVKFSPEDFAGFFARGGTLGRGKWGIAGENGPEAVVGPAKMVPGGGAARIILEDRRTTVVTEDEVVQILHDRDREATRNYIAGAGVRAGR